MQWSTDQHKSDPAIYPVGNVCIIAGAIMGFFQSSIIVHRWASIKYYDTNFCANKLSYRPTYISLKFATLELSSYTTIAVAWTHKTLFLR